MGPSTGSKGMVFPWFLGGGFKYFLFSPLFGEDSPGTQKSGCPSRGKTLPAGYITANALLSPLALKSLAVVVLKGRSQKLKEWEHPF